MKKKLFKFTIAVLVIAFLLPLSNLFFKADNSGSLTGLGPAGPAFDRVASLFEKDCAACHVPEANLPFYAGFPVARGLMEKDIAAGLRFLDLKAAFSTGNGPVQETVLAKIDHVTNRGTMPPTPYKAMHWGSGLGDDEKKSIKEWTGKIRTEHYAVPGTAPEFRTEVVQPLPPPEETNQELVALGDRLFHDVLLSGDDTVSCASCHGLDTGGTDRLRFSKGIRDQVGGINSPTVYNAAFAVRQFWDGRAADLKEQAGGPVTNPIEMDGKWPQVIAKLAKDPDYVRVFNALFNDGIAQENIQTAIAAFEETLVTRNSKFDRYLCGKESALTSEEREGYALFKERGCATCHAGKILGGRSFEYMGLRADYFTDRGDVKKEDYGLFNFTGKEADRYKFKVPTLRNIAVTYPYFHDGSTEDLREAVRVMGKVQSGLSLGNKDLENITAFLKTLTGEYRGKLLN
jgi:cytochrome c peroxidase